MARKNFGVKTYIYPQPVHHKYLIVGEAVGNAFSDGKKLK